MKYSIVYTMYNGDIIKSTKLPTEDAMLWLEWELSDSLRIVTDAMILPVN